MGWASGGDIFDTVARALVQTSLPEAELVQVLYTLADSLRDGDRDTLDESIDAFGGQPAVVLALRMAQSEFELHSAAGGWSATIEFAPSRTKVTAGAWILRQQDWEPLRAAATRDGWNGLVIDWARRSDHGDDYERAIELML